MGNIACCRGINSDFVTPKAIPNSQIKSKEQINRNNNHVNLILKIYVNLLFTKYMTVWGYCGRYLNYYTNDNTNVKENRDNFAKNYIKFQKLINFTIAEQSACSDLYFLLEITDYLKQIINITFENMVIQSEIDFILLIRSLKLNDAPYLFSSIHQQIASCTKNEGMLIPTNAENKRLHSYITKIVSIIQHSRMGQGETKQEIKIINEMIAEIKKLREISIVCSFFAKYPMFNFKKITCIEIVGVVLKHYICFVKSGLINVFWKNFFENLLKKLE